MKRLMLITFTALLTQISFAQTSGWDDNSSWNFTYEITSKISFLNDPTASSQDYAFEAPSSIFTSNGPWYVFKYKSNGYGIEARYLEVSRSYYSFKSDGTGYLKIIGGVIDDVDYQYVKKINFSITIPIRWNKTRDNYSLTLYASGATIDYDRNQVRNLSSREKYDWDNRIKRGTNHLRSKQNESANRRLLKCTSDIIMWTDPENSSRYAGLISPKGLNKLLEERKKY